MSDHHPRALYVLLALLLLAVVGGCAGPGAARSAPHLRVMSYNIKHGQGMDDVVDLRRAADVINCVRPDVVALLADEEAPVILAGDFNSSPGSAVMEFFEETWTSVPKGGDHLTFPSDRPDEEIDHFLYRPRERFHVLHVDVLDEPLVSDHRPLYADFALR